MLQIDPLGSHAASTVCGTVGEHQYHLGTVLNLPIKQTRKFMLRQPFGSSYPSQDHK